MLGGADNPNGELPSYITGADILCARPLNGSIIPGSVTRLRQDVSNSGAVMCFHMTWSNPPLLHGGMK